VRLEHRSRIRDSAAQGADCLTHNPFAAGLLAPPFDDAIQFALQSSATLDTRQRTTRFARALPNGIR